MLEQKSKTKKATTKFDQKEHSVSNKFIDMQQNIQNTDTTKEQNPQKASQK